MGTNFREKVIEFVGRIPKGKVASYGQIAALAGSPRAARQVGGILRALDLNKEGIPWWRVVNNKGEISIKGNELVTKEFQANLLRQEGVKVNKYFILEIEKYRYKSS